MFTAPFTAEAAEAVCGQGADNAMQDLSTLLDHSMISPAERPEGERAFRLLDPRHGAYVTEVLTTVPG